MLLFGVAVVVKYGTEAVGVVQESDRVCGNNVAFLGLAIFSEKLVNDVDDVDGWVTGFE